MIECAGLSETGEVDDVFGGDSLEGVAGFFPGGKTADDDFGFVARFRE